MVHLKIKKAKKASDEAGDKTKEMLNRASVAFGAAPTAAAAAVGLEAAGGSGSSGDIGAGTGAGAGALAAASVERDSPKPEGLQSAEASGGSALSEGGPALVVETPRTLEVGRGQALWALLAIGLFIAGVVLLSLGTNALWNDSAAAIATVRPRALGAGD